MNEHPIDALDGRTPLEVASVPTLDGLAARGEVGLERDERVGRVGSPQ